MEKLHESNRRTEELNDEVGYLVYNETLIDHFTHPRNVGKIENPDAMAVVGDPTCGDFIQSISQSGRWEDIRLQIFDPGLSRSHFHFKHCHGIGNWENSRRGFTTNR